MRRRALLVAFILIVAAPDCAAVLIRAVLDFTAIKGAAVTAYDARGKTAFAAVASFQTSPPLQFHLGQIEYLRADNGWMAVLRVILRDLVAIVHHEGFLDIVRAVGLLQDSIALIFFVGQDALNRSRAPAGGFLSGLSGFDLILSQQTLTGGAGDISSIQFFGNDCRCRAFQKSTEDGAYITALRAMPMGKPKALCSCFRCWRRSKFLRPATNPISRCGLPWRF